MKMRSPTLFAALLFSAPAAWCSTVIDNLASTPLPGQPAYGLTFFKDFGYRVASLFETGTKPTSIESITFRLNSNFSDSFLISLHSVQEVALTILALPAIPYRYRPARFSSKLLTSQSLPRRFPRWFFNPVPPTPWSLVSRSVGRTGLLPIQPPDT